MKNNLLTVAEFQQRRAKVLAQMPDNSIALFPSAQEVTRSNDTEFPFCQNKNFYYLTGFNEPDALLVLLKGEQQQSIMFCREKDPLAEVWHGRRAGPEQAQQQYGFEQCFVNELRDDKLVELLTNKRELWFCQGADEAFDHQLFGWLQKIRSQPKSGIKAPTTFIDCRDIIHEMRLIKSDAELDIMRRANSISCLAHQRAMEKAHVGQFEYQLEAELLHEFARHGARHPAYGTIVAGGDNANILHYTDNDDALADGTLVLIDAGGELAGYAADITRTFPVNGKFSSAQRDIYQLVLDAQQAVIKEIRPGQTFAALNALTCDILTEGLFDLGLLSGDLEQLLADKACKKYFIHGLGHWLGLDVHDVGDYHVNDKREQLRPFEPGMVMTIEPGLYIPADADVAEQYRGIGVRIEDNIVVTATGYENLTLAAAKTIDDIEQLMSM